MNQLVALVKGGTHTYDNVRATHAACNLRKRDKLIHYSPPFVDADALLALGSDF